MKAPSSSVNRPARADDPEPCVGAGQHRPEAHQQEHAGLHHGGRMQIGRDRRRRRHGVRQPEMERELRALGQGAEQDQDQRRRIERMRADQVARRQHGVEIVAADDVAEHQHRRRAGTSPPAPVTVSAMRAPSRAHPRGGASSRSAGRRTRLVSSQKIDQLDQVAGQHDAEHRAHEGEEERKEARHRIGRRHVVARVQHDQRSRCR